MFASNLWGAIYTLCVHVLPGLNGIFKLCVCDRALLMVGTEGSVDVLQRQGLRFYPELGLLYVWSFCMFPLGSPDWLH